MCPCLPHTSIHHVVPTHLVDADGGLPGQLVVPQLDDVPEGVFEGGGGFLVAPLDVADVAHHHVHDGVLDQAEEDEHRAGVHEHVDSLQQKQR